MLKLKDHTCRSVSIKYMVLVIAFECIKHDTSSNLALFLCEISVPHCYSNYIN